MKCGSIGVPYIQYEIFWKFELCFVSAHNPKYHFFIYEPVYLFVYMFVIILWNL